MAEPVMRTLEILVPAVAAVNGTKITYLGLENVPERGGALLALNHTSYVDWLPASLAALNRGRRLRFMIKAEMQKVRSVNFIIKNIGLIPVDRSAGNGSYGVAVDRLQEGELVGVHPEATISRSFELRNFKTGTVRMAQAAGVPIIPSIVWGAQRIWTKDCPKKLWRNKVPITAKFGEPFYPGDDPEQATTELHTAMTTMLHQIQEEYPHPAGEFWVPARLGGGAPTLAEALAMRERELAELARQRAEPQSPGRGRRRRRLAR